jgi:SHS2 domain-containing protein
MWEHFHHEADIGVRGRGNSREAAFEEAAIALTAVITDPDTVRCRESVTIECEAPDLELLFVDWLNALVYTRNWKCARTSPANGAHNVWSTSRMKDKTQIWTPRH